MAKKPKITPHPDFLVPVPGPYRSIGESIYASRPQPVDEEHFPGIKDREPHRGYRIAKDIPHGPTRNLLTAAPDLLDACEQAEEFIEGLPNGNTAKHDVLDIIRAALLKAKG